MHESAHHSLSCGASSTTLGTDCMPIPRSHPERMTGIRIAPLTNAGPEKRMGRRRTIILGCASLLAGLGQHLFAAEPAEVQRGLLAGNYAAVIKQAQGELRDAPGNTEWSMLLVRALLIVGKNAEADVAMKEAL